MTVFEILTIISAVLLLITVTCFTVCVRVCRAYKELKKEANYLNEVADEYFGNKEMLQ